MPKAKEKEKKVTKKEKAQAEVVATRVSKKKDDNEPPSRSDRLEILAATINKQYNGRAIVREGKDISNSFLLRRPTGIMSLDLALGGGFPAGGLSQIIGKDSSGKSYLTNRVISNVQNLYGRDSAISICMTEMPWDKKFAKWYCQVRVAFSEEEINELERSEVRFGRPAYSQDQRIWLRDQIGIVQETRAANAEVLLEIACQHVESNLYQVVMIDSFGALLTKAEAEAEEGLENKHRGGASMVITQFMHRLHAALNMPDAYGRPNTTTVIGINQYRSNVTAGPYGNPMNVAGGYALRHGKLVDLHVEQGKRHSVKINSSEYKIIGKEINWEILKGKAGCHDGPKGTYNFYFGEQGYPFGVDTATDLAAAAVENGAIEQNGAWYSYKGERLGQGAENVRWALTEYPKQDKETDEQYKARIERTRTLAEAIRMDTFARAGLAFITREAA